MALPIVSAEFWVATDPTLDFNATNGDAICKFRAKAQDRTFNRTTNQWENGKELWVNVTVWRKMAENVYESVVKGDNVVLSGKLSSRDYEKDGIKRTVFELDAIEAGPSMRFRSTPHGGADAAVYRPAPARQGASTGAATSAPQSADSEPPF